MAEEDTQTYTFTGHTPDRPPDGGKFSNTPFITGSLHSLHYEIHF